MEPIDAVASSTLYDNSSSSSGRSYQDALSTSVEQHSLAAEDDIPHAVFRENKSARMNSTFVYGAKPVWGWDFALSFKIPESLNPGKENQQVQSKSSKSTLRKRPEKKTNTDQEMVSAKDATDNETENDPDEGQRLIWERVEILARLKSAGFVFSQLLVPSEGVILVRLSLPESQMKEKAKRVGMELRLRSEYGGGYTAFSQDKEDVFVNYEEEKVRKSYFCPADRAIIILKVLQSKEDWGCDLNLERLLYKQTVLQAFAIHSELERRQLIASTVWKRIWDPTYVPPFSEMKDYMGARVAFYFVFVSFYARRLLLIALLSIPIYIIYRFLRTVLVIAILRWVFSIGLVLWTTVFLETWKRRNATVNLEWGLDDYKDDTIDETRPQFVGDIRYGFYSEGGFVSLADLVESDGNTLSDDIEAVEEGRKTAEHQHIVSIPKNKYEDRRDARKSRLESFGVTLFFVVLVGALTFLLLWYRNDIIAYFLGRTGNASFSNAVPGILNGLLITVFDNIWRTVSLILTRRENHRTNQDFENSLVYKRFSFQFVSNYISLLYIAFVRPYLSKENTCRIGYFGNEPDCMVELENQLMPLVITKATVGQITEIGIPLVTSRLKQWRARSKSETDEAGGEARRSGGAAGTRAISSGGNRYIAESKLGAYDSTMEDYGELVVQFGYVALFGVAFPPAAVVALVNNVIEGRTDAYKVLVVSQRVWADDAADIGAWYPILECLNVVSVATNAGLVVFTARAADAVFGFDESVGRWRLLLYRVVAFFVMEHLLLGVKAAAAVLIADTPGRVKRRAARQMYDVARAFDQGWREAFRGNSLLEVQEEQTVVCKKYADMFDVASEDEGE